VETRKTAPLLINGIARYQYSYHGKQMNKLKFLYIVRYLAEHIQWH